MPTSDESVTSSTLIGRVAKIPTDERAWSQFVDRYGPKILGWCRAWGLQEADAHDLSQTVFAKLHYRLRRFDYDRGRRFRGFLRRVVEDTLKDSRDARRPVVAGGSSHFCALLDNLEARQELADRIEKEFDLELLDMARDAIRRRVETRTWEAYRLTAEEGLSGAEASDQLGMLVANVFVAKARVLRMLQEEVRSLEATEQVSGNP